MPTPPRAGRRWNSISSSVTSPCGVMPSKVAALITRLRSSTGPSRAGSNTSAAATALTARPAPPPRSRSCRRVEHPAGTDSTLRAPAEVPPLRPGLSGFRDDPDTLGVVRAEVQDGLVFRRLVPGLGRSLRGKPQHDGDLAGRSFQRLGVAVDDDVFGAVSLQDRSDRRKVLRVLGLAGDRVVRNEVPGHDASGPDSRGRADVTG